MHKNLLVLFFIGISFFISCDKMLMKEKRQEIDKINLRGLLDTLHVQVFEANPLLIKSATLDHQNDSVAIYLDSLQWYKEFENFSDLKLRPGNLVSQFDESIIETDSCLMYHYTAKGFEKEDLDSFIIGLKSEKELRFLRAYINTKNFFSSSSQELSMEFSNVPDRINYPVHYHVEGWQKIKTKDTVRFHIEARIRY